MTDTCAHIALGWAEGEVGRRAAENLRANVTPGVMRSALEAVDGLDATSSLNDVQAPTLVFGRPSITWIPSDSARNIAARIPDARLSILDGESTAPYLGDTELVVETIQQFLHPDERQADHPLQPVLPVGDSIAESAQGTVVDEENSVSALTNREVQVLTMVASGKTNNEIASELVLSIRTVERHIGNIYAKIGARGRADATVFALTHGLV